MKVVQRVPLRFCFDADQDIADLRAGMSAIVSIDTGRTRSLAGLWTELFVVGAVVVASAAAGRARRRPMSERPRRHGAFRRAPC